MKNAWQTMHLGDLCDVLDHKRKPITKRDRAAGGYPYYGATGVLDYVADYLFDEPLVLVGEDGAKWDSGENTAFAVEGKIWVNNHAHVLRPHRTQLLDNWLIYHLNHSDLTKFVSGLTVPKLNQGNLREIPIPLPPLPEQMRIVGILDEAFEGIATAKANAEKNLQNARAIFESHLQSVFTQRGEGWVEKKLSEVCAITSALIDPRKKDFLDLVHVGAGNIETKTGIFIELKTAREEGLKSGKFLFDPSMVLYSKIRPYLMKVARPSFKGLCSADIYPLAPLPNQITRDYLFHLLLSKHFTDYAIRGSARTGMPKVNRDHLFEFRVWLPPVKKQSELAEVLNDLAAETQRLESLYQRKLVALEALKKSILHRAFAGELTQQPEEFVREAAVA
jgi:type I restriction enzyme, S subunit